MATGRTNRRRGQVLGKQVPMEYIQGGAAVSSRVILDGMKKIERSFEAEFKKELKIQKEEDRASALILESIKPSLDLQKAKEAVQALKKIDADRRKAKIVTPRLIKHKQRPFTASIALTRTPSYGVKPILS